MTDPPLSATVLRRLAMRADPNTPGAGMGPHLRRRQGHSLEFREYRAYSPGDDIRVVDWRASARHAARNEWIARSFEAEQHLTLAVMVDNRPEMALPLGASKLLFALWVARALTTLALGEGDEVRLARLFELPSSHSSVPASLRLRGRAGELRARRYAESLLQATRGAVGPDVHNLGFADLGALARELQPASAVVIISDMLFDDPDGLFVRFARKAQKQRRSLSIVQLDTIGHETAILRAAQEFHLLRPGVAESEDLFTFEDMPFAAARQAAGAHLEAMRRAIARGGLDWPREPVSWPDGPPNTPSGVGLLSAEAGRDFLSTLFVRRFPKLPLITGLGFGAGI